MGRERGREGGEFFVCFLFLGRRASAFGELGRRQGKQVVRWETRVGKREGRELTTKMLAFPPLAGDWAFTWFGCRGKKERT